MFNPPPCFTSFSKSIDNIALPEKFTFPFYYQPHELSVLASKQLQQQLATHLPYDKNNHHGDGKMFGVLVVQNPQKQIGFLSAYSGQVENLSSEIKCVPNVSTMALEDVGYLKESKIINEINTQIHALENASTLNKLSASLSRDTEKFEQQLQAQQSVMQANRKARKEARSALAIEHSDAITPEQQASLNELAKQSIEDKKHYQSIKDHWRDKITQQQQALYTLYDEIKQLKKRRKVLSKNLQKQLFAQYQFLNANHEIKDLNAIFAALPEHTPPSGAGDCAAPKLLQYAYLNNLKPLAMAEFWWGGAPKSAVRQHKNYYPSCYSKCQPILSHMLKGLSIEDNPLLVNPAEGKTLPIVYQDDDIVIVNKPSEFLSVPGVNIEDSVYLRIQTQFPHATGPLIVHRLDMSTSGLLVVALNKRAHKALQKQFIARTIDKRYIALVDGKVPQDSGKIELPLRLDFDDKPRQLVCYKNGKPALTTWQVLERKNNITRLQLYPKTGRTHQLRIHCAHHLGLNTPIIGDTHYGKKANRLHLHAEYLALDHPITHKRLTFSIAPDF
ncbi:RluA family pseudouridine synthase [Pseudoalteromonas sp. P1-25]|uniref:RluA family pseudouridine synthase n=1 Tax=Pseudoalteromonas sp. P1-25 TaxID=1723758 RepID=UPI0006D66B8D|nr:RluA family pseudouridine synthase [Pseudoalteromonas sp. P1-25]KPZ58397.1 Ribosomal large subunit pseudouridine synthase A [Pseudoalteromonas sp. P1-25]